ncbi:phosphonopyruvate decarboxylase [Patescibacteria group bacterium]|nr:phosphonopyruvate decarboxylase [Patescibacteria group bacterium]
MISSTSFLEALKRLDLTFFTGVPDSGLREFLVYLETHEDETRHVRAVNEGQAVGIAVGYHLATGKVPVVYLQNSGLGNAMNPLTSLADLEVYGIPMILFVAWRGRPGEKDEPQHKKMGRVMEDMFKVLEIPYEVAKDEPEGLTAQAARLKEIALEHQAPVALVFPRGIIEKEKQEEEQREGLRREEALEILLEKIGEAPVVSTTGYTSREVFEIREKNEQSHERDFLTVGSMGHASAIALGIARSVSKRVFLIDGDGAFQMHMGSAAAIGFYAPNLVHIVIDNGAHESTGGQPTLVSKLDWEKLFQSVGYKSVALVSGREELELLNLAALSSPAALVVKVAQGTRTDLGRPTAAPQENKEAFMRFLQG